MNKSLEYYSCHQIREGFVISRSNEICCCCKNYDKETVITRLPDNPSQKDYKELIPKIINFQLNLIESHKKDLLPNICRECPELCKKQWKDDFSFTWILLAHFKNCNLRCPHCTFLTSDKREINTPDSVAISLVKYIYDNYADKQLFNICIGGGGTIS